MLSMAEYMDFKEHMVFMLPVMAYCYFLNKYAKMCFFEKPMKILGL